MKRTKGLKRTKGGSKQSAQAQQARAVIKIIEQLEPARQRIARALEQAARIDAFDYGFVILAALTEIQEESERAGDRDLVQLLTPAIMLAYLRAIGHDREHAIRELRLLHGIGSTTEVLESGSPALQ